MSENKKEDGLIENMLIVSNMPGVSSILLGLVLCAAGTLIGGIYGGVVGGVAGLLLGILDGTLHAGVLFGVIGGLVGVVFGIISWVITGASPDTYPQVICAIVKIALSFTVVGVMLGGMFRSPFACCRRH